MSHPGSGVIFVGLCKCGNAAGTGDICSICGGAIPATQQVVWAEEAKSSNARVDPPRHAEQMAMAMYQRVARRKAGVERSRFGKTSLLFAGVCAILAVVLFPVDAALLHLASGAFAAAALVLGIKGLMGY